ncbi:MAG: glycosyltransferase family 4 protein [Acidobacteriota bacterium]|nr:glycosyltransferase family 4 protein [Acidobacteriota bacterium]
MSAIRPSSCPVCAGAGGLEVLSDHLHCRACGAYSLFPSPGQGRIEQAARRYQIRMADTDEGFDWRLFFLDLLLEGRGKIETLGARDSRFEGVAAARGYDLQAEGERKDAARALIAWDLLDYDPRPLETLEACRKRLGDDGLLLLRVRDRGADAARRHVPERRSWGCLNYFERGTLENLVLQVFGQVPWIVQCPGPEGDMLVAVVDRRRRVSPDGRRVLLIAHPDAFGNIDDAPGPRLRIAKTILGLRNEGWVADLAITAHPHCEGYDLAHLYHHAWRSQDGLAQASRVLYAGIPLVVSTIYMELSESNFAVEVLPRIFQAWSVEEREALLDALARGELVTRGSDQPGRIPVAEPVVEAQRALFDLADHLVGLSLSEIRTIAHRLGIHRPFTIVPNCADTSLFTRGSRERFVEKYGVDDFVISVGHLEPRKNQLMLLYALADAGLPLVIVGAANEITRDYQDLCRYYAPRDTLFISQLPQHELADAFAAARVHALPSWNEGASLASIEAAMSGCRIVVGDRAGEWEYYRGDAFYCSPASLASIRRAVLAAWNDTDSNRSRRLCERFAAEHSFEAHVKATLEAYDDVLVR